MAALSMSDGQLHVVWSPRYCLFLSAVESFWLQWKALAALSRLHREKAELIQAICDANSDQN
jgi:hypothetical protein